MHAGQNESTSRHPPGAEAARAHVNTVPTGNTSRTRGKPPWIRIAKYAGIAAAVLLVFSSIVIIIYADTFINWYAKEPVTNAFAEAFPGHSIQIGELHFSVLENVVECDTVTLYSIDSTLTGSLSSVALSGVDWFKILWQGEMTPVALSSATIEAENIALHFLPSQNEVFCKRLQVSVADSQLVIEASRYFSLLETEPYFKTSRFRQTLFIADMPQISIGGIDFRAILNGGHFNAGTAVIQDPFAEILVNMDRPYKADSLPPKMPNEALASIRESVSLDSIVIRNGKMRYSERVTEGGNPGVISFDGVNASVRGLAHHSKLPDTTIIIAEGKFMNSAPMTLRLEIPLSSPTFSLHYSGSLGAMSANALNAFLEPCEHIRITSGTVQSATYDINVIDGKARGALRVKYDDLAISILNKKTGSASGFWDQVASLYGKLFVIRGGNKRDSDGVLKLGMVRYNRQKEDYFLQFLWFSLRTGVARIVGF